MPRGFGRLPFLGRHLTRGGSPPSADAAAVRPPIDPDLAPIGPPILMPRVIIRQVLVDATELVPIWAMPRPEPPHAAPPNEAKATKRPRRSRATGTSGATPAPATPATATPATATPRTRTRKSSDNPQKRS